MPPVPPNRGDVEEPDKGRTWRGPHLGHCCPPHKPLRATPPVAAEAPLRHRLILARGGSREGAAQPAPVGGNGVAGLTGRSEQGRVRLASGSAQGRPAAAGGGEWREERGRRKERERGEGMAVKWAPLPPGVHVSETGHQNSPMIKNERFS